jgi:hypothetical protein
MIDGIMIDHLIPKRLTRSDFLACAGAGLAVASRNSASGETEATMRLGNRRHACELAAHWGPQPEGTKYRLRAFDLELDHKRNLAAMVGNPCCFCQRKGFLHIPDLASRVTILHAHNNLAAQLGDGREADGTTNRPDSQTNPALFAGPHSLSVDSKGSFCVVE